MPEATTAAPAAPTTPTPAPAPTVTPPAATPAQAAEATVEPSILGAAKAPEAKTEVTAAPEKYADFTLPEGSVLDKGMLDKFVPLAKELGLSQENAQKLVSFQAESVKAAQAAQLAEYQKTTEGWKAETIKALGADAEKELGYVGKALDAFGSKELRQLLDQTGFGNHPEFAKLLVKLGKAVGEDAPVEGTRHGVMDAETETKLAMFPSMRDQILNGKK